MFMQVDVTLSGHDHKYERTCPVYKKTCLDLDANGSATAPVHVVTGNAGYKLSWGYNPHTPPYWDAMALEHGYLRCEANRTFLGCEVSCYCSFIKLSRPSSVRSSVALLFLACRFCNIVSKY